MDYFGKQLVQAISESNVCTNLKENLIEIATARAHIIKAKYKFSKALIMSSGYKGQCSFDGQSYDGGHLNVSLETH